MTREFKYRPQYTLLLFGLVGLVTSFYVLPAIGAGEFSFALWTGLLGLSSLILTTIFLILFARQLGSGDLKITDSKIEIPGHWTKRAILNFNQITLIGTIDTWDKVIKISDGQRTYSIDGKSMSHVDLQELKTILKDRIR
jgi:hypothetical protein